MSTSDETHDEGEPKTGGQVHDQHADSHADEAATDFIPETSGLDQLLKLVVVLTGLGIVTMLFIWYNAPLLDFQPGEHASNEPPAPIVAPAVPEQPTAKPVP